MRKGQVMISLNTALIILVITGFMAGFVFNNIIKKVYELKQQANGEKVWQEKK